MQYKNIRVELLMERFENHVKAREARDRKLNPEVISGLDVPSIVAKVKDRDGEREVRFPGIVDATDLLDGKLPKPKDDLIEGLVKIGAKLFLGAPSKGRKSFTLINLAVALAKGIPFWGKKTAKMRVLYLNLEIETASFQNRLQKVKDALGVKLEPGEMDVWHLRGCAMPLEMIVPIIIKQAEQKYGAIILDPVYKCLGARNENDAGDMASFCIELERITKETGATIICALHYAKGNAAQKEAMDRIAGSGVLARDADAMVNLTPHEEADCFTVSTTLRDHAPMDEFVIRWEYPLMRIDHDLNPKALKGAIPTAAELTTADVLRACPKNDQDKMNRAEIIDIVKCKTEAGINRIGTEFSRCVRQGYIEEALRKRPGTNPEKLYAMTAYGERELAKLEKPKFAPATVPTATANVDEPMPCIAMDCGIEI